MDSHDITETRKTLAGQRTPYAVVGTRDLLPRNLTAYPYAIGVSISGSIVASSTSNRRFVAVIIVLLGVASFTLGVLLTEGTIEAAEPLAGVVPMYGVYRS